MTEHEQLYNIIVDADNEYLINNPRAMDSERFERIVDALISAGVLILPCKIGDKVYRLSRQCGEWKILPRKVLCITYHGGTRWCLYTTKGDILGDNVFLTKADAEAEVAKRIENDRDRQ